MNAEEARKLTKHILEINMSMYIDIIDNRIKDAAKKGKYEIINPHIYVKSTLSLNSKEQDLVRLYYENQGFKWTKHENTDPRNPSSSEYITLRW